MIIDSSDIILRMEFRFTRIAFCLAKMHGVVLCVPGWMARKSLPWRPYSVIKDGIEHIF